MIRAPDIVMQITEDSNVKRQMIACVALGLLSGALAAQDDGIAARVNGVGIPQAKVQLQVDQIVQGEKADYAMLSQQPGLLDEMRRGVVQQLVSQELLWQEARRRGHVVENEVLEQQIDEIRGGFEDSALFEAQVQQGGFTMESFREDVLKRMSVERMVSRDIAGTIEVSDQDIDAFYQANQEQMVIPEQVRVSHIMVKGESADEAALAQALEHARELLAELRAGADFGQLAREKSQAPSSGNNGDLGFIARGSLVKPFEDAAFALQSGEMSEPVRVGNDYHLLKVTARTGGNLVSRDEAAGQIEDFLVQKRTQEALQTLLQSLREEGEVTIY